MFEKARRRKMTRVGVSEDEREPTDHKEPRQLWVPRCASESCAIAYSKRTRQSCNMVKGVPKKGIKYRETFCPDCGYALYWEIMPVKKGKKHG